MTSAISYPPHPAEGRRLSAFVSVPDALNPASAWPVAPAAIAPPGSTRAVTAGPAPFTGAATNRQQHWLADDPSAHSKYPVD